MAYQYTNQKGASYYLHSTEITLRGSGKRQTIYYFAKEVKSSGSLDELPAGYRVIENQRTGLPVLKKS